MAKQGWEGHLTTLRKNSIRLNFASCPLCDETIEDRGLSSAKVGFVEVPLCEGCARRAIGSFQLFNTTKRKAKKLAKKWLPDGEGC